MTAPPYSRNKLLRSLTNADFALLEPSLTLVDLAKGEEFALPEGRIGHSWFPTAGLVSVVATTAGGDQAEVGVVGREGMFAVSTLHGVDWGMMHIFCQIPGSALRMPAARLQSAMAESPTLQAHLLAYAHTFMVQTASSALAYATRTIEARLARWLLMSLDRLDVPEVALTHEALSLMLGVRRAGVTVAIHNLEAKGAVVARRAALMVTNRALLADIAADSYGTAEVAYERAIGAPLMSAAVNGVGPRVAPPPPPG